MLSTGLPCSLHLETDRAVPAHLSAYPGFEGLAAAANVTRHSLVSTLAATAAPLHLELGSPLLLGAYPIDIMQVRGGRGRGGGGHWHG